MLQCEPYFLLRTPLLPFSSGNTSTNNLKKIFTDPLLQEALFLASPALHQRLADFLDNKLSSHESERVAISLSKYLLRFCSRATPFGLFAGVSLGNWAKQTQVELQGSLRRSTRLDTNYVTILVKHLLELPEVSRHIRFFPNNTIYTAGDKLRYIDYLDEKHKRTYRLSSVEYDSFLTKVLNQAVDGKSKEQLVQSLVVAHVDEVEAADFVEDLVRNNLLVSELEIRLSGQDYFSHVCHVLKKYQISLPVLDEVHQVLKKLDHQSPLNNLNTYPLFFKQLQIWAGNELVDNFIQVDAARDGQLEIHERVAGEIQETIKLLSEILPIKKSKALENFREAFFDRYEFMTVDLCMVMDPEIGLGYPLTNGPQLTESPLLSKISFRENAPPETSLALDFQTFLIDRYVEALQRGGNVVLSEDDLKPFLKSSVIPSSLYAMVSISSSTAQAIDSGDFQIYFNGAYGPSAATLMARFCHLSDSLAAKIAESIKKEEHRSDVVFAEIIHAAQPRMGNISTRPVLREYEIPILAVSGVDKEHNIALSDLTLTLVNGRLMLRSRKLDCEVIPRLSSAHNYAHDTVSVYRFLCDLQFQGVHASMKWDWGVLKSAPFLPQVSLGNVILSRALWQLSKTELLSIRTTNDLKSLVNTLRETRKIPQYVRIGEGDNKISIDLENEHHLCVFQKLVEKTDKLEAEAAGAVNLFILDNEQRKYMHELIVPMKNVTSSENKPPVTDCIWRSSSSNTIRKFSMGSEWLYYKLYCSVQASEQILVDVIKPLATKLVAEKIIDKWFFVRYADPHNHVRLRFHGNGLFYNTVIERFYHAISTCLETGLISRIGTDTYQRELERYGQQNIEASESLFFIDSVYTLDLLEQIEGRETVRWKIAIAMADQLFSVFDISLEDRCKIFLGLQQQFFDEMNGDAELKRSLAIELRKGRTEIETVLDGSGLDEVVRGIMKRREGSLRVVANDILHACRVEERPLYMHTILKSYLHMSLNRLWPSHPRHYEMVLYDFLYQYYHSSIIKVKSTAKK